MALAHSGVLVLRCASRKLARAIGILLEVWPVGMSIAEQDVHHRAGERAVAAGTDDEADIGLLDGAVAVDVDGCDPRATLFARAGGVGHHVDLRVRRIGAPDHDEIGLRHLARVGAGEQAGARDVTGLGERGADQENVLGIALDVAQAVDAVAHHEAHGAGVEVQPDAFRAVLSLGGEQRLGGDVERITPGDALEPTGAFRALPAQRMHQAVAAVDARARRSGRPSRR